MSQHVDAYEGTDILWLNPGLGHMTMRRAKMRAFLEATGGQIMAQGRLWNVTTKHLGGGIYRVSTRRWKDSDR